MLSDHRASSTSANGPVQQMPALATSTSTGPSSASTRFTAARTASRLRTSASMPSAPTPSAPTDDTAPARSSADASS